MSLFSFSIPMAPVGKGRPRFTKKGFAFTPEKTRSAEAEIKFWALNALKDKPTPLFDGPLDVRVSFVFRRPKSVKRQFNTTRPDLDNLIKLFCDSLNGLVWVDDSQVCHVSAKKEYGPSDIITIAVEQLCNAEQNKKPPTIFKRA